MNKRKTIHVLSWGGGTQSTALMIKFLKGEVLDHKNNPIKLDYIIFADTNNESEMTYQQVYKVKKYVKDTYDQEIYITKRNEEFLPDNTIIEMIQSGEIEHYRQSKYYDLFQAHVLNMKGIVKSVDMMPLYTRDDRGVVGKTSVKACTGVFKINQLKKQIRILEGVQRFTKDTYKIVNYIGFSVDEVRRLKPSMDSYMENQFPLVWMGMSKIDCINYVEKELGFVPRSSVCNMCYANDVDRVYDIYINDRKSYDRLLDLDDALQNKHANYSLNNDLFMFKFQADNNLRLKDIDMEEYYQAWIEKKKTRTLFDDEQEFSCMGGCFL